MVFSALDPLADPAIHKIPRRSGDGQGVNHRDQDKGQLDVDSVKGCTLQDFVKSMKKCVRKVYVGRRHF